MAKAIDICAQKSSTGLNAVKEKATEEVTKEAPSMLDSASKLLGK